MAVVGALLPSVARRRASTRMGLAVFAALPFLTSLLSLLAGRIGPRTPHASAPSVAPWAPPASCSSLVAPQPLFIALAMLGFWLAMVARRAHAAAHLDAASTPRASRGRLLGIVGSGRSLATMAALLAFTLAAARAGWLAIVAVVAIVGIVAGLAPSRLDAGHRPGDRQLRRRGVHPHGPASAHAAPHHRSRSSSSAAAWWPLPALIAMIQVDRLGLSIGDIAAGRPHGCRRHDRDLQRLGSPGQPHQRAW